MTVSTTPILDLVRSNFNFEVNKYPLTGPDNIHTPLYGLFRSDTFDLVGSASVTSRYVPHTVDDVLALVESTETAFEGCEAKCLFSDGHYVTIAPSDSHRVSIYGTNDNVFPRITISAGFDGKAFKVMAGYFRDACSNLAMMRSVRSTTVKVNHNGGLRDRLDELKTQFARLKDGWGDLVDSINNLQAVDVNLADFLRDVYGEPTAETGREVTIHQNRTETIFDRVMKERAKTGRPSFQYGQPKMVSAWEAYNAVQGYVQHKATRKGSPSDYQRVIAASSDKAVLKAETLAFQLAG